MSPGAPMEDQSVTFGAFLKDLLSPRFHTHFFIPMLMKRLRTGQRQGTSFPARDGLIALAFCCILIAIGVPYAMSHNSIIGWIVAGLSVVGMLALFAFALYSHWGGDLAGVIGLVLCIMLVVTGCLYAASHKTIIGWVLAGVGAAGILALLAFTVYSHRKEPPTYESFLAASFFFFVILGVTVGIFVGALEHSRWLELLGGCAGLLAGYILGLFAGVWFQYLGWLAAVLNMFAVPAIIGVLMVGLVLLFLS